MLIRFAAEKMLEDFCTGPVEIMDKESKSSETIHYEWIFPFNGLKEVGVRLFVY